MMKLLVLGTCLLTIAFLIHWCYWRICVPKNPYLVLLLIYLSVLPIGLFMTYLLPWLRILAPQSMCERVHLLVFYIPAALAYIVMYSGLEEDSPTLTMVKFVAQAGSRGRTRAEFKSLITDDIIVNSRLCAMVRGGVIACINGRYHLTPKGGFWARIFHIWRRFLGVPRGG